MAADRGTAVPKFGAWDESNPSSGEGYTGIFNKVREEKQIGLGNAPSTPPPAYKIKKQETGQNAKTRASEELLLKLKSDITLWY